MTLPFAYHEFKRHEYPFKIEWFRCRDKAGINPVKTQVVELPETGLGALKIEGLVEQFGITWVRITFADGRVEEARDDC